MIAELSTFSIEDKTQAEAALRAAGHVMLDCPLSGTGAQARTKDLIVYASGDAQAIQGLMPVFADFSRQAHDLGAFGNGMKMKFVANLLVAIHNVASAEAMVLGIKAGLDPAQILKLISVGRRQLAGVRVARADDGRGPLRRRQRHDAHLDLAEGHEGDRRIRGKRRLPDAAVLRLRADLSRGAVHGIRRAGHRGGVRGAGAHGRRQTMTQRSEIRDEMRIDWDVPITMDDGLVVRADIFRPIPDGQYPVILTYGPYAKGLAFQDGYPSAWQRMVEKHPDVAAGSSNLYQSWEVVDPEKWVPAGYVCVRVDLRGAGCSPGFIDHFSPRETKDFYDCIEWAGVQPWSNGKVGLNGISYYGINAWHVASLQPPHLAAMCVWEGAADWYRDMTHHGGMLSTFWANWYDMQVKTVQYGAGERGKRSRVHGELVCGPETLSEEQLAKNRCDFGAEIRAHPLDDDYHKARSPKWDKITAPLFSAANWGGQGLHPRGNFEGFMRAASKDKWLEAHGIEHWTHFYTDYGRELQRKFFDYFLKDEDTGWGQQPRVLLQVRHPGEKFVERAENEWPIARTKWTKLYLNSADFSLVETSLTGEAQRHLRRARRRRHLHDAAAAQPRPRSPGRSRRNCSSRHRPPTPTCS